MGTSARGGRTHAASYSIAGCSSVFPTRMRVILLSAVATTASGPWGSFGRDASLGSRILPPHPVRSRQSPTT